MTETAAPEQERTGPPPPASLAELFADAQLPPTIAALADADRADLLSLVQQLHQDQIAELIATGPKMLDALPLLIRKAIEKMVSK